MKYVYVKDNEGFVIKKLASEVQADETIITKQEYEKLSGDKILKFMQGIEGLIKDQFSEKQANRLLANIKQEYIKFLNNEDEYNNGRFN